MNVPQSTYVCKTGQADEKRLNAQAELTTVPLREAINKWKERLNSDKISILIDFGCGVGSSVYELKSQFPHASYIGIDRSQEQIDVAKKAHPDETFMVGDQSCDTIHSELHKADLIYMQFVAMHQTNLIGFFGNIIPHMKPGAQLLIFEPYSDFNKIEKGIDPAVDKTQKARFELSAKVAESVGRTYNAVTLFPKLLEDLGMANIAEYSKVNMCFRLEDIGDSILIPNWKTARDGEHFRSFITVEEVDSHCKTLQEANGDTVVYIGDSRIILAQQPPY